jgi:hypothetical protein
MRHEVQHTSLSISECLLFTFAAASQLHLSRNEDTLILSNVFNDCESLLSSFNAEYDTICSGRLFSLARRNMLDPLTALSLASSIVQFVDFAGKVVSKCRHIHGSIDGVIPEHHELDIVATDLVRLSTRLKQRKWSKRLKDEEFTAKYLKHETPERKKEREEELAFKGLSDTCTKIADELLERLSKHKVPDGSSNRKWKSFRQALETVWSKKELEELAARLAEIRQQMSFHVLIDFKYALNPNKHTLNKELH